MGYGSVKGKDKLTDRDTVFEFYVVPPYRNMSRLIFRELLSICEATYIECQSNDLLTHSMLCEFAHDIKAEVALFEDHVVTEQRLESVLFRPRKADDLLFEHISEPVGGYVLEFEGRIVASGGFLLHYNHSFADLYMEVDGAFRKRGFGSFLIQEVKRECYLAGRVPAARCNIQNAASRATLERGGLKVCGFMLEGKVEV